MTSSGNRNYPFKNSNYTPQRIQNSINELNDQQQQERFKVTQQSLWELSRIHEIFYHQLGQLCDAAMCGGDVVLQEAEADEAKEGIVFDIQSADGIISYHRGFIVFARFRCFVGSDVTIFETPKVETENGQAIWAFRYRLATSTLQSTTPILIELFSQDLLGEQLLGTCHLPYHFEKRDQQFSLAITTAISYAVQKTAGHLNLAVSVVNDRISSPPQQKAKFGVDVPRGPPTRHLETWSIAVQCAEAVAVVSRNDRFYARVTFYGENRVEQITTPIVNKAGGWVIWGCEQSIEVDSLDIPLVVELFQYSNQSGGALLGTGEFKWVAEMSSMCLQKKVPVFDSNGIGRVGVIHLDVNRILQPMIAENQSFSNTEKELDRINSNVHVIQLWCRQMLASLLLRHVDRDFEQYRRRAMPIPKAAPTLDDCATKIQTTYRGHAARKRADQLRRMRSDRRAAEDLIFSAAIIQAIFRRFKARKRVKNMKYQRQTMPVPKAVPTLDECAVKIQTTYRGHAARKRVQTMRQRRMDARNAEDVMFCAACIQALFRQFKARRRVKQMKEAQYRREIVPVPSAVPTLDDCATKIQTTYRGHAARKSVGRLRAERNERRAMQDVVYAAVRIQALFRMFKARRRVKKSSVSALVLRESRERIRLVAEQRHYFDMLILSLREVFVKRLQRFFRCTKARILRKLKEMQYNEKIKCRNEFIEVSHISASRILANCPGWRSILLEWESTIMSPFRALPPHIQSWYSTLRPTLSAEEARKMLDKSLNYVPNSKQSA